MFALGDIDPLLVSRFEGFNQPQTATLATLLSDGTSVRDQVLQQGSTALLQADVSGTLQSIDDLTVLRGYNATKESVAFTDGRGDVTIVRVFDLRVTDYTDWWTFAATLVEADEEGS